MIAWALANIAELATGLGALFAMLIGLRWKWKRDGVKQAKLDLDKKDRERADEIRDSLDRNRAQRVRELDDAGWRDGD